MTNGRTSVFSLECTCTRTCTRMPLMNMPSVLSTFREARYGLGLLLLAMIISGCATDGSGPMFETRDKSPADGQWQRVASDSELPVEIRYFGFIDVTQDVDGESQYFEAGFARFTDTAPLLTLLDSFRQAPADSCDYRQRPPGDSTPLIFKDELELPGYPYQFVDAGSRIDVIIGNRSYARLKRTSTRQEDAVQYETDVGSLPLSIGGFKLGDVLLKTSGLIVSSQGGTFPAFTGIAVPPVAALARFRPRFEESVSAETRFRWRKNGNETDPDTRVQIEAGGGGRALFCAVTDDGEYELPDSVKARLGDARIPNLFAYRDAIWFYLHGDALLIVSQSSYY